MPRLSREHDEDAVRDVRQEPPAPEPAQAGSLAWASAIGNQAVQRLARQGLEEDEAPETEAPGAQEGEPAAPTPLVDVDDLAEDELPD
jgi:hypothetical protein